MNYAAAFTKRTGRGDDVADAVNALTQERLEELGAWAPLADLSSATELETIDANLDSIIFSDSAFELIADVNVTLNYPEDTSFSDSYGAVINGHMLGDRVSIERVTIDVSSFYE